MTTYTVYLSKPILDLEYGDTESNIFEFCRVATAKKFIKKHMDIYKSSCITKVWSNGDWENLGEIKLNASNKHFIANARMKKANY